MIGSLTPIGVITPRPISSFGSATAPSTGLRAGHATVRRCCSSSSVPTGIVSAATTTIALGHFDLLRRHLLDDAEDGEGGKSGQHERTHDDHHACVSDDSLNNSYGAADWVSDLMTEMACSGTLPMLPPKIFETPPSTSI